MSASFVVLTAAKNEERFIGRTIASVCAQTARPWRWIIVDDGSTDGTASVVRAAMETHSFIRLHTIPSIAERSFGAKSRAIHAAYRSIAEEAFDFVVILDADIAFGRPDVFAAMLAAFAASPRLGIAGGEVMEPTAEGWKSRKGNRADAVAGAIQMIRRTCYDECGGYVPLRFGGEDWLVQIDAQMRGWGVDVLRDQPILHFRPTSSAGGHWRGLFRCGLMDASFGSDPSFEALKCLRRVAERPFLAGAIVRYAGFLWWHLSRRAPLIPPPHVAHLRQHQRVKVRRWIAGFFGA